MIVKQLEFLVDLQLSVNNKQTLVRAMWCLADKKVSRDLQRYFKLTHEPRAV